MAQSAGYKHPLSFPIFWQKASLEPPLELSKWAAMMELAVSARDGKGVRNLLRAKPPVQEPAEPIYNVEITGETKAQKRNRDIRNQKKTNQLGK